jgi:ASPM-SPD-2-Hydin domain-containing protein/centrosomal CEP192-like protein
MGLSSRWDRCAGLFFLLLAVLAMVGCQALFGGSPSKQNGVVSAASMNLNFGTAVVGSTKQLTDTLTNRSAASVTIASATSSEGSFQIVAPAIPFTMTPGQSIKLTIAFTPQAPGHPAGKIAIKSNTPSTGEVDVSVSGGAVAAGKLALSPTSLAFGSVRVGQSQAKAVTLTNPGGTSVTVSQDSVSSAAFTVGGLTLPLTLAAGQSASFNVTFAPQSSGAVNGSVRFNGNSSLTMNTVGSAAWANDSAPTNVALSVSGDGSTAGQLGATPAGVSFGNVQVGNNQAQTVSLTNGTAASVTITQAVASGSGFGVSGIQLPLTLGAGQSASFTATFSPASTGAVTGNVVIASSPSNTPLKIGLSGTGVTAGALSASPSSIAFNSVPVGSPQSRSEVLSNTGGSALQITNAAVTGTGFALSGISVPTTLNAGQSLTFNVIFTPQSGAAVTGTLALTASGTVSSLGVSLSGTGKAPGQLSVAPATANFGHVKVGASQNQAGSLTASGAGVTLSGMTSSNAEFTLTGLSLPLTLSAGQSAPFTLTFKPQASGAASGTITFTSNATNTSLAESVTGTGMPAPQHSVSLSWTASTSSVVGYNVYRGTQSGGPYDAITSAPDANKAYTDSTVVAGSTYYYVVTAVDSSGNESVYSNQAQAVIPTP